MQVGIASSEENPNSSWLNSRGVWVTYVLAFGLGHLTLLSIPFLTTEQVWTATNVIHSIIMYLILHHIKGTPWLTGDQGKSRKLTHWEQIDHGTFYTDTKKFLTIAPTVIFILAVWYTKYDRTHFLINFMAVTVAIVPKLPVFHRFRLFDINKY